MRAHPPETDLALYASGDLSLWRGVLARLHMTGCERCRGIAEAYRADRERVREIAAGLPEDLDWDRLAAEMTANIRVGLAAGECVAPARRPRSRSMNWRPAAVAAGVVALLAAGWLLNMPASTTQALGRALSAVVHGGGSVAVPLDPQLRDQRGLFVSADEKGIELHENGASLGLSLGTALPVTVSVSVQGSASARYVDADTGQMTITSVYAQ